MNRTQVAAALATAAMAASAPALAAETKTFAKCYGDHHGSYVDFVAQIDGQAVNGLQIAISNDSDDPAVLYTVSEVKKNGDLLQPKAYSWAIRQAIKSDAAGEWYGFVFIKAVAPGGSTLFINLSKFTGSLRHALAIDGYIEELTCPLDQIVD